MEGSNDGEKCYPVDGRLKSLVTIQIHRLDFTLRGERANDWNKVAATW